MTDVEKARMVFREAGLAFPAIPEELATRLRERREWLFSTREIDVWPYELQHYVGECSGATVQDYALLSHSGHGVNSYALQYYLVQGPLGIFLHLGWGGAYMDAERAAAQVRDCFSLADSIVVAVHQGRKLAQGERLIIVASDFYGSYWLAPGERRRENLDKSEHPVEVLTEVLRWLEKQGRGQQ